MREVERGPITLPPPSHSTIVLIFVFLPVFFMIGCVNICSLGCFPLPLCLCVCVCVRLCVYDCLCVLMRL